MGRLTTLEPRQAIEKLDRLARKITKNATNEQEVCELMVVAEARHRLVPALKNYVDLSKAYSLREFVNTIEGWERSQPQETQCFRKIHQGHTQ